MKKPIVSGVYKIVCGESVYVGSSIDIHKRSKEHLSRLRKGNHSNWKLQKSFSDRPDFQLMILEECGFEMLDSNERKWIGYLIAIGTLPVNLTSGGKAGYHHADETKDRIKIKTQAYMKSTANPIHKGQTLSQAFDAVMSNKKLQ